MVASDRKLSFFQAVVNVSNLSIGIGVLAKPYAFALTGWLAIIPLFAACGVCAYLALLIGSVVSRNFEKLSKKSTMVIRDSPAIPPTFPNHPTSRQLDLNIQQQPKEAPEEEPEAGGEVETTTILPLKKTTQEHSKLSSESHTTYNTFKVFNPHSSRKKKKKKQNVQSAYPAVAQFALGKCGEYAVTASFLLSGELECSFLIFFAPYVAMYGPWNVPAFFLFRLISVQWFFVLSVFRLGIRLSL